MSLNHSLIRPLSRAEITSAAVTSSSNSGNLTLPLASVYQWILDVTVASGTGATLDVYIQTTPDNGTTFYNTGPAFRAIAVADVPIVDIINVQVRSLGSGASEWVAWSTTNKGQIAQPVILTRRYRIAYTLAGVTPSFTFAVWLICQPKGSAGL